MISCPVCKTPLIFKTELVIYASRPFFNGQSLRFYIGEINKPNAKKEKDKLYFKCDSGYCKSCGKDYDIKDTVIMCDKCGLFHQIDKAVVTKSGKVYIPDCPGIEKTPVKNLAKYGILNEEIPNIRVSFNENEREESGSISILEIFEKGGSL